MDPGGSVQIDEDGGYVEVAGDADLNSADALDSAIERVAGTRATVLVDLTRATLLDSRIIAVLATWAMKLRERGGELPLICTDPNVRHLFEVVGLDGEFEFRDGR